jgi:protein O-mannosyl-transferase
MMLTKKDTRFSFEAWFCKPSVLSLIILIAGACVYSNSLHGVFLLDDASSIAGNPTIRHLSKLGDIFSTRAFVTVQSRPILNLSLALNYAISGTEVWSYHLFNILIHIASGLFLFGIVRRILELKAETFSLSKTQSIGLGFIVALIWTVHPLQTESVTYIIQRAESLMGFFFLGTFYFFVRAVQEPSKTKWYTLSVIFCALGMATKEVMVTAPVLVLLLDKSYFTSNFKTALAERKKYYAGLLICLGIAAVLVVLSGGNRGGTIGFGTGVPWLQYEKTQCEALVRYIALSFWPHPLVFEYGTFTSNALSQWLPWGLVLLPVILITLWALYFKPMLGFIGAWFFCILSPTSLVPGTSQMIVEHRMYLPLVAVLVAGIWFLWIVLKKLFSRSLAFNAILIFGLVSTTILGAVTLSRNADYNSAFGMWTKTVEQRPKNALAHVMLAEEYVARGNDSEALKHYETALSIYPTLYIAQEEIALLYIRNNEINLAKEHNLEALRLFPNYPDALNSYGVICMRLNQVTQALDYFARAISYKPNLTDAYYNQGNAYAALNNHEEAIRSFKKALTLNPSLASAYFNLGNSYAAVDRKQDAIDAYQTAVKIRGVYPTAEFNIANLDVQLGKLDQATLHYNEAIRQKPNYVDALNNLAVVLVNQGKIDDSVKLLKQAIEANPLETRLQENLNQIQALKAKE